MERKVSDLLQLHFDVFLDVFVKMLFSIKQELGGYVSIGMPLKIKYGVYHFLHLWSVEICLILDWKSTN